MAPASSEPDLSGAASAAATAPRIGGRRFSGAALEPAFAGFNLPQLDAGLAPERLSAGRKSSTSLQGAPGSPWSLKDR